MAAKAQDLRPAGVRRSLSSGDEPSLEKTRRAAMRVTQAGVLALAAVLAGPVYADCSANIATAEAAAAKADATTKAEAEKHITEAKSHLNMGHEDVCQTHVDMANAALKTGEGKMTKPAGGY
ncbi:MAG: hypothetical protein ABI661_11925 [Gammaproteobacteria bacterium]